MAGVCILFVFSAKLLINHLPPEKRRKIASRPNRIYKGRNLFLKYLANLISAFSPFLPSTFSSRFSTLLLYELKSSNLGKPDIFGFKFLIVNSFMGIRVSDLFRKTFIITAVWLSLRVVSFNLFVLCCSRSSNFMYDLFSISTYINLLIL